MVSIEHSFSFKADPEDVVRALTEQDRVRGWWTAQAEVDPFVGGQVKADFGDGFARFTIDDLGPRRVVWRCTDARMQDTRDWVGTTVEWLVEPGADGGTWLTLIHDGFRYESRSSRLSADAWAFYAGESLARFLHEGTGMPYLPAMSVA